MAFIPEAHGFKCCCEGFGLFPSEPKGFCFQMLLEVFSQRPELQPGMRRPGAPGTALCLFCKFRSPALNPQPPGGPEPYLEPQVGDLENKTPISWLLTPVFWQQTPSIPRWALLLCYVVLGKPLLTAPFILVSSVTSSAQGLLYRVFTWL